MFINIMSVNIRRKKTPTVWKHGGRGKMRTVQVPDNIKDLTYQIALILDNESDFCVRLKQIEKILQPT